MPHLYKIESADLDVFRQSVYLICWCCSRTIVKNWLITLLWCHSLDTSDGDAPGSFLCTKQHCSLPGASFCGWVVFGLYPVWNVLWYTLHLLFWVSFQSSVAVRLGWANTNNWLGLSVWHGNLNDYWSRLVEVVKWMLNLIWHLNMIHFRCFGIIKCRTAVAVSVIIIIIIMHVMW